MKVYVIRHGESENNLKSLWTGWQDAALTESGIADARRAGEVLSTVKFDKVFSSDLSRAYDTAINAIPGCTPEKSSLCREINVGSLAGNPLSSATAELRALIPKEGYKSVGGESQEEFRARVGEFMGMLETLPCENVAVFAHAGWLRGFLDSVMDFYIPRRKLLCANCAIGVFEYLDGGWRLNSWINL